MTSPSFLRSAVPAGEWLAVSGQIGARNGKLVDGVQAQTAQALANLLAVVEENGARVSDVVKVNVYLTSMGHYDAMNAEYAIVFNAAPPARTAVAVSELPFGALVEVEAWVHRKQMD